MSEQRSVYEQRAELRAAKQAAKAEPKIKGKPLAKARSMRAPAKSKKR